MLRTFYVMYCSIAVIVPTVSYALLKWNKIIDLCIGYDCRWCCLSLIVVFELDRMTPQTARCNQQNWKHGCYTNFMLAMSGLLWKNRQVSLANCKQQHSFSAVEILNSNFKYRRRYQLEFLTHSHCQYGSCFSGHRVAVAAGGEVTMTTESSVV